MIASWLAPVLAWTGLDLLGVLALAVLIVLIVKD